MGFRKSGLSLLIFLYIINLASSYRILKTLPSEFMQKSWTEGKRIYVSKIEGGSSHGGGHGGSSHGNGGENGGSRLPNNQGGAAAVIPVYTAGAANNNRNRHVHNGAANCNLNRIKFSTTFVYPLILLFLLM